MIKIVHVHAVIPTVGRTVRLCRTIESIFLQDVVPTEILIVDAGSTLDTRMAVQQLKARATALGINLNWQSAVVRGAAAQRNQGAEVASEPYILFLDDDVDLDPGCLAALWNAMEKDASLGGCNAVITNQHYSPPGRAMRYLLAWLGCPRTGSLAGRCCGPALNFLPARNPSDGDERVDWLNTTCTFYRRSALPSPPFLPFFNGYSLMEDLALSLEVGKRWQLCSLPAARIYHDSAPASYKSKVISRQAMEVANRWFIARHILQRPWQTLILALLVLQCVSLLALLRTPARWACVPGWVLGSLAGLGRIIRQSPTWSGYPRALSPAHPSQT